MLATLAVAAAIAGLVGLAVMEIGAYDVSARVQHTQVVYSILDRTRRNAVRLRARSIAEPELDAPSMRARGLACFARHCASCHGAPGVAPERHAIALQPLPRPLLAAARHWRPRELFWIADNGIKMSGMPAFGIHVSRADLWAIVAFLQELPRIAPNDYQDRAAVLKRTTRDCERDDTAPEAVADTAPRRDTMRVARELLRGYGCHGCHAIPGITGAHESPAAPLDGFARRALIAGRWPLDEETLVAWIRAPRELDPNTAMPDMGVTATDARTMARYLLTLD